jgi:hypothetical protein
MIPVYFTFAGDVPTELAERMVLGVNQAMPGAKIFQLTDESTNAISGTEPIRLPRGKDFIEFSYRHLMSIEGDFIRIDYDVFVQKDLTEVFNDDFEVGLTIRTPEDKATPWNSKLVQLYPHNLGVAFSKGKHSFWKEQYEAYRSISNPDGWMDACTATEMAYKTTRCRVRDYPCFKYNYTPVSQSEDVSDKYAVHYKGIRKAWMVDSEHTRSEGLRVGLLANQNMKRKVA